MAPQGFVTAEEKSSQTLILIIDKKGIFGKDIAQKMHVGDTTVFVTAQNHESQENFLVIPYQKPIPEIPEGDYTHIFFVWDGAEESLHVLEPLLQKASSDRARFIFVTDCRLYNEKLHHSIHKEYSHANIILTGDVFGNEQYESIVTLLFKEAHKKKFLELENVGLKYVYPVLFADATKEIFKIGFGPEKGKLFLACQAQGMTELSLAHLLQKIDPFIKIDFKKEGRESVSLPEGIHLFDVQYNVARKIQDAYAEMVAGDRVGQKTGSFFFSPMAIKESAKQKKKNNFRFFFVVILIIFLLLSPFLLAVFYGGLGGVMLYATTIAMQKGEYQQAADFAKTSKNLFTTAIQLKPIVDEEFSYMFLGKEDKAFFALLGKGEFFSSLAEDGSIAVQKFLPVAKGQSVSPQADFLSSIYALKSILITLASTPAGNDGIFATASEKLQPLSSVIDSAPALFGFPDKKTYMILFQNNTELRPGGGFVGSYALITFANGRVADFSTHDVYDADGQLKGHVEPPFVIRRFIPEQHWYLRDSNFDVDFSQDSKNAAFFLEQETGQKVDGVIGIDLTFVKDILSGIGPVYVPGYNQTVTADNFFFLTESHAEKNTFAGSTQKKDFLSALLQAMQTKMTTTHGFSPKAMLPILSSLQQKDIVFGFSDPNIQDVFTVNGLSDSLWDGRNADAQTLNDATGINEANIGVNKANYFVTRKVDEQMTVDKSGNIMGRLNITYKNTSQKGVWPGGPYKNYLRLILPGGTKLTSILLNGKAQTIVPAITDANIYEAKNFTPPAGLEVDSSSEEGKELIGFVVTVPEQTTETVEVEYTLSQKVDLSKPTFTYDGWLVKQPGVDPYSYNFSLTVPNNFSLITKPNWVSGSGNSISFAKSFGEDTLFSITFSQK